MNTNWRRPREYTGKLKTLWEVLKEYCLRHDLKERMHRLLVEGIIENYYLKTEALKDIRSEGLTIIDQVHGGMQKSHPSVSIYIRSNTEIHNAIKTLVNMSGNDKSLSKKEKDMLEMITGGRS